MHKRIKRNSLNIFDTLVNYVIIFVLLVTIMTILIAYFCIGLNYKVEYKSNRIPIQYSGYNIVNISNIDNNNITYEGLTKLIPNETGLVIYTGGFVDDNGNYSETVSILNSLNKNYKLVYVLQSQDMKYKENIVQSMTGNYIDNQSFVLETNEMDSNKFLSEQCDRFVMTDIKDELQGALIYKEYIENKVEQDKNRKIVIIGLDGQEENDYDSLSKVINGVDTTDSDITKILVLGNVDKLGVFKNTNLDLIISSFADKEFQKETTYNGKSTVFITNGTENKKLKAINYRVQHIVLYDNISINRTWLERMLDFFSSNHNNRYESIEEVIEYKGNYNK